MRKEIMDDIRIEKLQRDFKNGKIAERDIANEDKEKLIELYKKQNKKLQEKLQTEKNQIREILNNLK